MKVIRHGRHFGLVTVAAVTMCAVSLATAPAAVAGAAPARWRLAARTPGFLDAVVAPAVSSAWALGWAGHDGRVSPVARHWNGRRWTVVAMPKGVGDSGMACAGASSPRNVWAFAGAGASQGNPPASGSALRLRNGRWVLVKRFPGSYVTGCNVLGPRDVWVFGGAVAGLGPPVGTWHLTRSGWTQLKTGHLVLFCGSAVSASDIWATGADVSGARPVPLVARWNGRAWVPDRSVSAVLPRPTGQTGVGLDQITALSPDDVWADALVEDQGQVTGVVVVHWNGHRWRRVGRSSVGFHLPGAVRDGHGGWWAVPFVQDMAVPYLLHERGGRWTRFPLPVRGSQGLDSYALARVPGTSAMLAVGGSDRGGVVLARGRP